MLTKVFAVYDSKANAFMSPFFMPTTGQAVRAWGTTVNDPQTDFNRYPGDFTLFEIASYDDISGKFENLSTPHSLGLAQEFLREKTLTPAPLNQITREVNR